VGSQDRNRRREPPTKPKSSTAEVKIRDIHQSDLEALYALDQLCFRPGIAYSKAELWHFIVHPRSISFIAEAEDGSIAAFVIAASYLNKGSLIGHVITIDVDPALRRQGLGHLLMETIEADLAARGAASMKLEVAIDDAGAQAFYRRHGYEQTGRISGFYNGILDAVVMEKALNK